jgi:hypothetical protein
MTQGRHDGRDYRVLYKAGFGVGEFMKNALRYYYL